MTDASLGFEKMKKRRTTEVDPRIQRIRLLESEIETHKRELEKRDILFQQKLDAQRANFHAALDHAVATFSETLGAVRKAYDAR